MSQAEDEWQRSWRYATVTIYLVTLLEKVIDIALSGLLLLQLTLTLSVNKHT